MAPTGAIAVDTVRSRARPSSVLPAMYHPTRRTGIAVLILHTAAVVGRRLRSQTWWSTPTAHDREGVATIHTPLLPTICTRRLIPPR